LSSDAQLNDWTQPERAAFKATYKTEILVKLMGIYDAQGGRCFYSGAPLDTFGLHSMSIERLDNTRSHFLLDGKGNLDMSNVVIIIHDLQGGNGHQLSREKMLLEFIYSPLKFGRTPSERAMAQAELREIQKTAPLIRGSSAVIRPVAICAGGSGHVHCSHGASEGGLGANYEGSSFLKLDFAVQLRVELGSESASHINKAGEAAAFGPAPECDYRGVSRNKKGYMARIYVKYQGERYSSVIHLGTFATAVEAAHRYDAAVREYGHPHEKLNFR
jgi:hypothetical protein